MEIENFLLKKLELLIKNEIDILIINGPPGSGKTHSVKRIIEYTESKEYKIILLAPTGTACRNLANKTNSPVKTIHSEIYEYDHERSNENAHFFKLRVPQTTIDAQNNLTIVIIDEASMINGIVFENRNIFYGSGMLLNDIFQSYPENTKFIFIGDSNQLPPISEDFSPALCKKHLKENFNKQVFQLTLNGNYRQKDNDIYEFAKQFISEGALYDQKY